MALQLPDDEWQRWLQGWSQPLAVEAPEYGAPTLGAPTLPTPPPPPPPPPPQQIGPTGMPAPVDEIAPASVAPPPAPEPALPLPGAAIDTANGPSQIVAPLDPLVREAAAGPVPDEQPNLAAFDPLRPETWATSAAPEMPMIETPGQGIGAEPTYEESLSAQEIAQLSPQERLKYQLDQEQRAADFTNRRLEEIRQTDAAKQEQDENDFMDAHKKAHDMTVAAIADSEALANEKPAKFGDSLGRVVAGVAAIFMGQFGSHATGGKNVALDLVQKRMDDFAQEQVGEYNRKAGNVDRRLNMAAKLRDAGYNEFQTKSVLRMAGLQRSKAQLLTEMQNFDPKGTQAMKHFQAAQQLQAAYAQQAEAFRRQSIEDNIKLAELAKKRLDVEAQARKLTGVGGGAVKAGNLSAAEVNKMLPPGAPLVDEKSGGYSTDEAKAHVDLAKTVTDEGRKTQARYVGGIVNAAGEPFEFASEKEGESFRKQKAAIDNLNALLGEVSTDIENKGGTVKFFNTAQNKKYSSRLAQIDMEIKEAFGTGALDKGSQEVMDKMKGGDPTSVLRGGTEGLDALRDGIVRRFNFNVKAQQGYDGPGYDPPFKPRLQKAGTGPNEQRLQQTITASYLPSAQIDKARSSKVGGTIDLDPLGSKENVDVHLEMLEKDARRNDADARDAKETLRAIADGAKNKDVKKRAAEILKSIPAPRTTEAR